MSDEQRISWECTECGAHNHDGIEGETDDCSLCGVTVRVGPLDEEGWAIVTIL
jgi:hypothetical protein